MWCYKWFVKHHTKHFNYYIVFNKCDDYEKEYINNIKEIISKINPFAAFEFTDYAKADTKQLLNLKYYEKVKNPFRLSLRKTNPSNSLFIKSENHHHDITSQSFIFDKSFDLIKLRHYLTVMLFIQGGSFYRIKGILNIEGLTKKLIIQSVKLSPVFIDGEEWQPDEIRETKIVFIGKKLKRDIIEKGMKQCHFHI